MKKAIKLIFLGLLVFSCSYLDKNRVIEIETINKPIEKKLEKYSNNEILNDKYLSKKVFNRQDRKVNKDLKGIWVATVFNRDFPKTRTAEEQKREIDKIVENAKKWGFNAIFFHVKPDSGALYNSSILVWSEFLTGTQGVDPGYDPLQYFIEKAHENGIELHAWINPYRVSVKNDMSSLAYNNFARLHPEYVYEYGGKLYLNPAKKEVVTHLYQVIEEIVRNYDVDGIHLDDYFYPYQDFGKLPNFDRLDFVNSGYSDLADFRRDNVNNLIRNLSVSIHKIKPNISFGVSPFGIWRNSSTDPIGSNTNGTQSYDTLYADSLKWMQNSWVDYIAPQIYWEIGHSRADYYELVDWWAKKAEKTNTTLYIGEAVYKLDEGKWNSDEPRKHKIIRDNYKNINGFILFRYGNILNNTWIVDEIK